MNDNADTLVDEIWQTVQDNVSDTRDTRRAFLAGIKGTLAVARHGYEEGGINRMASLLAILEDAANDFHKRRCT